MPIVVPCGCGVKLKVRDENAGRRVRCPKCSTVLAVPAADPESANDGFRIVEETAVAVPAAASPAPAPSGPAKKCIYCGGKIATDTPSCPHCGHIFVGRTPEGPRSCPYCAESVKPATSICPHCKSRLYQETPGAEARDLAMEANLRAIGMWWRVSGILLALGAILICVGASMMGANGGRGEPTEVQGAMYVLGAVILVAAIIGYLLGHLLARYSNAARIAGGIFCILAVVMNLFQVATAASSVGTSAPAQQALLSPTLTILVAILQLAMNVSYVWVLFSGRCAEVCRPEYGTMIQEQTSAEEPSMTSSPFFWFPLVVIGISLFISVFGVVGLMSDEVHPRSPHRLSAIPHVSHR